LVVASGGCLSDHGTKPNPRPMDDVGFALHQVDRLKKRRPAARSDELGNRVSHLRVAGSWRTGKSKDNIAGDREINRRRPWSNRLGGLCLLAEQPHDSQTPCGSTENPSGSPVVNGAVLDGVCLAANGSPGGVIGRCSYQEWSSPSKFA
jgi:hypothetical protein